MTRISPLRFFAIAPLHSPYMLLALGAAAGAGVILIFVNPAKGADALGPVALLQMFAASSGFAVAARRGHLDLLLTGGSGRVSLALTHLLVSVAPGLLAWFLLGIVEMLALGSWTPTAFASGTVFAIGCISMLSWALTVPLPRLSGGIAWLLAIAIWIVGWSDGDAVLASVEDPTIDVLTRALVVTLCPFVLLGKHLSRDQLIAAVPLASLGAGAIAVAVLWIARTDVPLESAQ